MHRKACGLHIWKLILFGKFGASIAKFGLKLKSFQFCRNKSSICARRSSVIRIRFDSYQSLEATNCVCVCSAFDWNKKQSKKGGKMFNKFFITFVWVICGVCMTQTLSTSKLTEFSNHTRQAKCSYHQF